MDPVFKAVYIQEDEKFVSLFTEGKFRVTYKLHEKAIPPIGALFCFGDLDCAKRYMNTYFYLDTGFYAIMVGEWEPYYQTEKVRTESIMRTEERIHQFWVETTQKTYLPASTVLAEWFIPRQILNLQ